MTHPAPAARPASPLAAPVQDRNALPPYTAIIDGRLLRQLRRQRGLSIDKLAHRAGVGITTLGRLERQDRPRCRMTTLARLAIELGADPAAIAVLARLGKNEPPRLPPVS
ncbi:MAG: helix-turn-helix domain-containing protein [Streptosporangiaceae bacterium]